MKKIAVLCSHIPKVDPRVVLLTKTLSEEYDVSLFACGPNVKKNENCFEGDLPYNIYSFDNILNSGKNPLLEFSLLTCLLASSLKSLIYIKNLFSRKKDTTHNDVTQLKKTGIKNVNSFINRLKSLLCTLNNIKNIATILNSKLPLDLDLIYANDLETLMPAVLYKIKFPCCKIIYDCHEFYPYSHDNPPFWYIMLLKNLERKLIRYADLIITVSPFLAEEISRAYNVKVDYILNAEIFSDRIPLQVNDYSPNNGKINFLLQGSLRQDDGLYEFIQAWDATNTKQANLYIRVTDNLYKQFALDIISSLKSFNHSIFFLHPVAADVLVEAAMNFDVGVISYKPIDFNYRFCCPNKFNQFLNAGLAILSANTEFVSSVVKQQSLGLIYDPNDCKDMINKILTLINDHKFLQDCKNNSINYARYCFNWQGEGRKLINLVKQLETGFA